jgi:CheY-like chemotaxis protein
VIVNADPIRLAQIISNVLDNAVKFTPKGGSVDIDVLRAGPEAVLRVADSGIGIDPDMLPRVFELFAQAKQAIDRSVGGLGIGLALSHRLVDMHGGTITAASEGPGRGAQFVVRLPVDETGTPPPTPQVPIPDRARTILVIEDNHDAREALHLLLESFGHRVLEAANGPHGLALVLDHRPEVVLVDLGLPGMDGYEVAREIRLRPVGRTALLIAVTGYGQADDRRRSKDAGFDAHLVKPVSPSLLSTLIATA